MLFYSFIIIFLEIYLYICIPILIYIDTDITKILSMRNMRKTVLVILVTGKRKEKSLFYISWSLNYVWISLVTQLVKNRPQCRRP